MVRYCGVGVSPTNLVEARAQTALARSLWGVGECVHLASTLQLTTRAQPFPTTIAAHRRLCEQAVVTIQPDVGSAADGVG